MDVNFHSELLHTYLTALPHLQVLFLSFLFSNVQSEFKKKKTKCLRHSLSFCSTYVCLCTVTDKGIRQEHHRECNIGAKRQEREKKTRVHTHEEKKKAATTATPTHLQKKKKNVVSFCKLRSPSLSFFPAESSTPIRANEVNDESDNDNTKEDPLRWCENSWKPTLIHTALPPTHAYMILPSFIQRRNPHSKGQKEKKEGRGRGRGRRLK
jgi:hypothetical protein